MARFLNVASEIASAANDECSHVRAVNAPVSLANQSGAEFAAAAINRLSS
jgi:hypothetical protein